MAYYSGTAASLTALRTALLTHAQADGWVLTGDVLSKAGVYFQIQETAANITCLGCESNAVLNPAPAIQMIGTVFVRSGYPTRLISFPCTYEVFGFAQELYLVVNYDVDSYQWMAFGKSTVPGLPGQGGWSGATIGHKTAGDCAGTTSAADLVGISNSGGYSSPTSSAALFWFTGSATSTCGQQRNCWVNHGMASLGWRWKTTDTSDAIGIRAAGPLLAMQPSAWNSEAVLLPVRAYVERLSFKSSMVVDLVNARHVRMDNLSAGDILTIGSDKWKAFPWYRKDATTRDGGNGVNHTGTFGWAIRYEWP